MARIDRTAFAKALHEAHEREHDQQWQDAIDLYADLLASLGPSADPERRAMRAIALMRRGNALMELRRWDEARGALDEALHDAKASGDRAILAQALLAAGVFAANRDDRERAEAFLLDALERFHRDDAPASLQGRGWAFLNLATLYGKTGRFDLAFVTFTKARTSSAPRGAGPASRGRGRPRPSSGGRSRMKTDGGKTSARRSCSTIARR